MFVDRDGPKGEELMARRGRRVPRETVVMAMEELQNEVIRISVSAPCTDHPQEEVVLFILSSQCKELFNRQRRANLLLQHH